MRFEHRIHHDLSKYNLFCQYHRCLWNALDMHTSQINMVRNQVINFNYPMYESGHCGNIYSKMRVHLRMPLIDKRPSWIPSPIESETNQISHQLEQDWLASSSCSKRSSCCCWHPWQSALDCRTFYFACLYLDHQTFPVPKPCAAIYPKHSLPIKKSPYPCEYGCSWTCWYSCPCAPYLPLRGSWTTYSFLGTETLLL